MKNKKSQDGLIAGGIVLFMVVIVGIIIVLFMGFDTVDASHIGVKNRFGEIIGTMNPGMQWTGLFVHVEQYDLRTRKMVVEMLNAEQTAIDRDGQTIKARIMINYRFQPNASIQAYSRVGLDIDLENILNLDGIVREGFKTATSQYTSTEIWQQRGSVKDEAIKIIERNFPKDYFQLDNVIVSDIDFNPAFIAAIEQQKTNEKLALAKEKEVEIAKFEANRKVEEQKGLSNSAKLQYDADAYKILKAAESEAKSLELKRLQITPLMVQNNWIDAWRAGGAQVPKIVMGNTPGLLMQMPSIIELEAMK